MAIDVNISTQFINDTDTPASYVGAGSYKVKVKADETGIEFVPDSAGSDTNIMNTNLTANANRTQDLNSFSMYFNNGKQFKWLNNVAPTIGEGSFDFQGYGTTSSDNIVLLKNGSSLVKVRISGDGRFNINEGGQTSTVFQVRGNGTDYWIGNYLTAGGSLIARFGSGEVELNQITGIGGGAVSGVALSVTGRQKSINLPTYADNATALIGGLTVNDEYKTVTGERRIVV